MHGFMETVCSRKIWCWKKNSREEKRQKGIEIPENEYVEAPALDIPYTAQIVDANKQVFE